jgi:hypothetical protein
MVTVYWGAAPCIFEHTSTTTALQFIQMNELKIRSKKQPWTGPEVSRRLRFPDFKTIDT